MNIIECTVKLLLPVWEKVAARNAQTDEGRNLVVALSEGRSDEGRNLAVAAVEGETEWV